MDQQGTLVSGRARTRPWRRIAVVAAVLFVLVALVAWALNYWFVGRFFVTTDDAYVAADSSVIAPKVSGYVSAVLVENNQPVRKGQVLFEIDDRDYRAALASTNADIQAAQAAIYSDTAQIKLQQTRIAGAAAQVEGDKARLAFASSNERRYASLLSTGASTKQNTDQATTDLATARAALNADDAALAGAERQVDVLNAELAQAKANLAQSLARAWQATLDLGHTQVRAPFDGVIGNKNIAVGDYLQAGTQVMAVVPLDGVYVIANFKETQLDGMHPGQPVTIAVDSYPNLKVTGTVRSISPASGQEFALLPPDNATGNFTKIVQRVPVKIVLDLNQENIGKLRPGMSVEPDIDIRPHSKTGSF